MNLTKSIIMATVVAAGMGAAVFFMFGLGKSPQPADDMLAATEYLTAVPQTVSGGAQAYILPISEPSYMPILDSEIPRPKLDARAAVVYDMRSSRFLYEENIRRELPVASLTKVLTAATVLEKFNPEDIVTVSEKAVRADGSKQDLYAGEQLTIKSLLSMMLIGSSNDAAYALTEYAREHGVDLIAAMNEKSSQIGMNDSHFFDPAGLNDEAKSTAYDLIKLVRATIKYRELWTTLTVKEVTITSVDGKISHTVKNTDQLLDVIPNIVGGKTGFTDGAQGCLILLVNLPEYNDTIVSVVLGSRDRFGDTQKIIDWVKSAYRWE